MKLFISNDSGILTPVKSSTNYHVQCDSCKSIETITLERFLELFEYEDEAAEVLCTECEEKREKLNAMSLSERIRNIRNDRFYTRAAFRKAAHNHKQQRKEKRA